MFFLCLNKNDATKIMFIFKTKKKENQIFTP